MGVSLLLASAAAGCFSRSIVHPLDTLRSRLMVSKKETETLGTTTRQLLRENGFKGLYRGFGISIVMQAPAIATYLAMYDWTKARISEGTSLKASSPLVHMASGLVAETVSCVFWVPMEVVKQRAQIRTGAMAASSSAIVARDLVLNEGPSALFRGYGLTIAVFGPYAMIYFMVYERLKAVAQARRSSRGFVDALPLSNVATSAAGASAVGAACTTPLDVIKTRIQTQGDVGSTGTSPSLQYKGAFDAARSIVREEGARGLFRGISARVLWIMPSTAITMSSFEFLKKYFQLSA